MFVIQRNDGKFVARSGSKNSYTKSLQMARVYPTKESAQSDLCPGNEHIVPVENLPRESRIF